MSFKDFTPEQRRANARKAQATIAAKKAARAAGRTEPAPAGEVAPTLADLGLPAQPEDDFRVDEILTNEEIQAIRAEALRQVEADLKKSRRAQFLAAATEEARRNLGLVPVDEAWEAEMKELGDIRINLPRLRLANGRECPPDPIILDQRVFAHGRTYVNVEKHQRLYLMERMARAWEHVAQVDGRSKTYYNEQLGTMMYPGGPASGGSFGALSFDAIHRRAGV